MLDYLQLYNQLERITDMLKGSCITLDPAIANVDITVEVKHTRERIID